MWQLSSFIFTVISGCLESDAVDIAGPINVKVGGSYGHASKEVWVNCTIDKRCHSAVKPTNQIRIQIVGNDMTR